MKRYRRIFRLSPRRCAPTVILGLILLILTACDAEPTPFPVDMPSTPTPTPLPLDLPPLRYGLLPNTAGAVPDLALIQGSGVEVIQLTDMPGDPDAYDLIVGYGDQPGWTKSELVPHIALVLNTEVTPLDQPEILSIVQRSLHPAGIVTTLNISGTIANELTGAAPATLKTEFANLGLPDGIALVLGVTYVPGAEQITAQLRAANIETQPVLLTVNEARTAFADGQIQAALVIWALDTERNQWVQQFGEANVIDLYSVPISYQVKDDLQVTFTPSGFPLVTR